MRAWVVPVGIALVAVASRGAADTAPAEPEPAPAEPAPAEPAPAATSAQPARATARLYYQKTGASACPEVEEIRAAVATRFGYDPFVDVAPITILVAISIDADGVRHGRISVIDENREEFGLRELTSQELDCAELAATVELAIGLAVPAAVKRAETTRRSAELAAFAAAAWTSLRSPPVAGVAAAPVEPAITSWRIGLGGHASVGAVPGLAPGVALGVEVRRGAFSLGADVIGDFAPAVRVGLGQIHASLVRLAITGCRRDRGFALCALAAGGASHASATGFPASGSATTPYAAIGGRVAYELVVSGRWSAMIHLDAESAVYAASLRVTGEMPWEWTAPGAALSGGLAIRSALP